MHINAMRTSTFLHQGIPSIVIVTKRLHIINTACFDRTKSSKTPTVKDKKNYIVLKSRCKEKWAFFVRLYQKIILLHNWKTFRINYSNEWELCYYSLDHLQVLINIHWFFLFFYFLFLSQWKMSKVSVQLRQIWVPVSVRTHF